MVSTFLLSASILYNLTSAALLIFFAGTTWTWIISSDFTVLIMNRTGILLLFIKLLALVSVSYTHLTLPTNSRV